MGTSTLRLGGLAAVLMFATTGIFSTQVSADSVLDKVKRDKKIVVGSREAAPPYAYVESDGSWVGWAMDLSRAIHGVIEKKLGTKIELEFKPVTPQTRIPLVVNGSVDWVLGTTGRTVKRDEVIDYAVVHNATCIKKLVPKDSAISATKDMAGMRIGVTKGSVEERLITEMGRTGELTPPAKLVGFDKHSTGFIALSQGKTDAHVTLDDTLNSIAMKSPNPENWEVRGPDLFCIQSGILLPENDSDWRDMVNHSMCYLIETGEFDRMYDVWFAGPEPKSGYQRELSADIRALIHNQCPFGSEKFLN